MVIVNRRIDLPALRLGLVEVTSGTVRSSSELLLAQAAEVARRVCTPGYDLPEVARVAVRKLLKQSGFSPTGRNRPAQELLVRDLQERGSFHHINNVVDVNNVASLESLVPISVFDVDKLGGEVDVRLGEPGEAYVFNASGHVLDVKRLIVCARAGGEAIGSPVKDSAATKVFDGATHYLGVMYAPASLFEEAELREAVHGFASLLASETGGVVVQERVSA